MCVSNIGLFRLKEYFSELIYPGLALSLKIILVHILNAKLLTSLDIFFHLLIFENMVIWVNAFSILLKGFFAK